jgi:hypothetical protein
MDEKKRVLFERVASKIRACREWVKEELGNPPGFRERDAELAEFRNHLYRLPEAEREPALDGWMDERGILWRTP